ncbi:hypothetical protein BDF19DRAFT_411459 [Syncephalis fuscata]|nr:hypothetical protein BDF19DRAFT_411459 [Syncephalis fuscata]
MKLLIFTTFISITVASVLAIPHALLASVAEAPVETLPVLNSDGALEYTLCDTSSNARYQIDIDYIKLSPYPLQSAKKLPSGAMGHVEAQVSLFKFKFDLDTCEQAAAEGKPCPIPAGRQEMTMKMQLPSSPLKNIKAKLTSSLKNGDGSELICFKSTVAIA